jgi:hypothetical protein
MKEFKIPQKLTGLVRATLEHTKYRVKVAESLGPKEGRCHFVYFQQIVRKGGQKFGDKN